MAQSYAIKKLKQTRADLLEALDDLQLGELVDFRSSITRERNPSKGKHVTLTVEYLTAPPEPKNSNSNENGQ